MLIVASVTVVLCAFAFFADPERRRRDGLSTRSRFFLVVGTIAVALAAIVEVIVDVEEGQHIASVDILLTLVGAVAFLTLAGLVVKQSLNGDK